MDAEWGLSEVLVPSSRGLPLPQLGFLCYGPAPEEAKHGDHCPGGPFSPGVWRYPDLACPLVLSRTRE